MKFKEWLQSEAAGEVSIVDLYQQEGGEPGRKSPQFYEAVRRMAFRYAREKGYRSEAEDFAQEAMLWVAKQIQAGKGPGVPWAIANWIRVVFLNFHRGWVKRASKRRGWEMGYYNEKPQDYRMEVGEEEAKEREAKIVRQAIDALPEVFRRVVILHYFEQLPLAEIAERLQIPLGTVKRQLFAAREKIKNWIEDRGFREVREDQLGEAIHEAGKNEAGKNEACY